jgi:cell wall-associated NlpC family hydrolase
MFKSVISSQARTWIGTKFKHQGRIKKSGKDLGGCDCIGLVIGVFQEVFTDFHTRFPDFCDKLNYSRIVKEPALLNGVQKYFKEKSFESIEEGDLVLFSFSNALPPQHIGIIGKKNGNLSLIHAFCKIERVTEHFLDDYWKKYLFSVYELR